MKSFGLYVFVVFGLGIEVLLEHRREEASDQVDQTETGEFHIGEDYFVDDSHFGLSVDLIEQREYVFLDELDQVVIFTFKVKPNLGDRVQQQRKFVEGKIGLGFVHKEKAELNLVGVEFVVEQVRVLTQLVELREIHSVVLYSLSERAVKGEQFFEAKLQIANVVLVESSDLVSGARRGGVLSRPFFMKLRHSNRIFV